MSADDYAKIIASPPRDRLDLFLATANRLGAPVGNIEKDFWVCWTLDALYHRLPHGGCHVARNLETGAVFRFRCRK